MEEIRPLTETSNDELFRAREEAFRGYERNWTNDEYLKMLHRRGYVPDFSFGAFDRDRLVSFTLNGIGLFDGTPTAYDTGTGTIPEYRGKGLATKIFLTSLPYLKQAGIQKYILEVLQHNQKAISVYTNLGFAVIRELNYFIQDISTIRLKYKTIPHDIRLREIDLAQKGKMASFWDFMPSWQNQFESVLRSRTDFRIIGAFHKDELVGYGMISPATGDIPQLAIEKTYRRNGIGTCLLEELLGYNEHSSVQFINTEADCASVNAFLQVNGILKRGMQFEMTKDLL